jgi:circadian clock protein KaiC
MSSIGIDLHSCSKQGFLTVHATRPTLYGLEMHLLTMHKLISQHNPRVVVIDPLTNMLPIGTQIQIQSMFTRLIDFLKRRQITALFVSLTPGGQFIQSEVGISSLIDTWIVLRDLECGFTREHSLHILKSRGMAHSKEVRKLEFTNHGISLLQVSEDCDPSNQRKTFSTVSP